MDNKKWIIKVFSMVAIIAINGIIDSIMRKFGAGYDVGCMVGVIQFMFMFYVIDKVFYG